MASHTIITNALAEAWPDLDELVAGDVGAFETAALQALRDLDVAETSDAPDAAQAAERAATTLVDLIETEPAVDKRFKVALSRLATSTDRTVLGARSVDRYITFPLLFA